MKISELIQELEFMRNRYGDIDVKTYDNNGYYNFIEMVDVNAYRDAVVLS